MAKKILADMRTLDVIQEFVDIHWAEKIVTGRPIKIEMAALL